MSEQTFMWLVPLVFLGVGGLFLWIGLRARRAAKASAGWPQTFGTVTRLDVETYRQPKGGTRYKPQVQYSYEVAGRSYLGDKLRFADPMMATAAGASHLLAPYTVGGRVPVFYDPASPEQSTLSTSADGTLLPIILGGISVVIALFVLCWFTLG